MKTPPPISAEIITREWVALRREIIVREGWALRPACNVQGYTIEAKSLTTNEWLPITLEGGALAFALLADRDRVLAQLEGSA